MGFLRGRWLLPTLFNLYTNDLPVTGCQKFIYADDICLTKQAQWYAELECCLSSDMLPMTSYCHLWQLKPSPIKTVTSMFQRLNIPVQRVSLGYTWKANNSGISCSRSVATFTATCYFHTAAEKTKSRGERYVHFVHC